MNIINKITKQIKRLFWSKQKRQLARQIEAGFVDVQQAIARIRKPVDNTSHENNARVYFDRIEHEMATMNKFYILKYEAFQAFGSKSALLIVDICHIPVVLSFNVATLSRKYWNKKLLVASTEFQEQKYFEKTIEDSNDDSDEIRKELQKIQTKLQEII